MAISRFHSYSRSVVIDNGITGAILIVASIMAILLCVYCIVYCWEKEWRCLRRVDIRRILQALGMHLSYSYLNTLSLTVARLQNCTIRRSTRHCGRGEWACIAMSDNRGSQVSGVSGLFLTLTWIFVSLRIYCRLVIVKYFGFDDFLAVVAQVS